MQGTGNWQEGSFTRSSEALKRSSEAERQRSGGKGPEKSLERKGMCVRGREKQRDVFPPSRTELKRSYRS